MTISTIFIYLVASFILNLILTSVEHKKQDNLIDYIVISNIYILILSGIFTTYNLTPTSDNIFIIVLFQVLGRILYQTLITERTILKNNDYNLKKYLLTLFSSYLLNILIINKLDNIFPSNETIKLLIWLFIIGYGLLYLKKNIEIKVPVNNNIPYYEDREYIVMQYAKYKNKYNNIITSRQKYLNSLIYAMMIYANYHKPELLRKIDLLKYRLFREDVPFGIMQINKSTPITDEESIITTKKKLERIYTTNCKDLTKETDIIKMLIKKYYKNTNKEIELIYKTIKSFEQR